MLACAKGSGAQQPEAERPRSTLSGVFSQAQAAAGRDLYSLRCRSCHTPEAHAVTLKTRWAGRPLSEIFGYVGENMPKDNPGTLESWENAQVLAYLLRTTGMPAGTEDLPPGGPALGKIRFDTLVTKPGTTGEGVKP